MQTTRYRLQREIEQITPDKRAWFQSYLKEILESDTPYYAKSDTIALSFMGVDNKIAYLTQEIQALTALKKELEAAKGIGLEVVAETMTLYGIDKMEGAAISSLSITPPKIKTDQRIEIKNPAKVMELGYVLFDVDETALKQAIDDPSERKELDPYIKVTQTTRTIPSKLKINQRRTKSKPLPKAA
jgi:hypothetical protein